ncbi:hypothetical protein COV20_00900 [Candidatus Woesearchaeota archaeon CG10_big_fil_rev_8_21_14_0_10_45_16]|nr:MAG: hypothetical protein COV20_00900 [Candidatus Woesearchaeota archaeon CG10_big_fil_rev_8_21_14_0_10_45_16]
MKDVFITSTLHNDWNVSFNPKLCEELERRGISCHLPQRDTNQNGESNEKFSQNINGINNSKKILGVALNVSPNWGGEVGFSYGSNKPIILLAEDTTEIPLMLEHMSDRIIRVENINNIEDYINQLISIIKN